MENKWVAAISGHDAASVQPLIARDYMGVTPTGKTLSKTALLAEIKNNNNKYTSVTNDHLAVRVHGTAAVVTGTTKQIGTDKEGKEFTYSYRWTDTWAERDGTWQCIASQSLQVPN